MRSAVRRFKREGSTHRTDGMSLEIEIEGTDTEEKIEFGKSVSDEVEKGRDGRPLFVLTPRGYEITYKCAWEFGK